jgi:hypothetical protein
MLRFPADVERKTFVNKYSILRNMKYHVYGEKEISAAQRFKIYQDVSVKHRNICEIDGKTWVTFNAPNS